MTMALTLRGISKSFGATSANHAVDLDVASGSIHGLIGENGAGKSTLMSIVAGLLSPDTGSITVDGRAVRFASVAEARACGIGMVHQHFMLVDRFNALDNILLSAGESFWLMGERHSLRERVTGIAAHYGLEVPLDVPVEHLSVCTRQRVEILKELTRGARILILDEPTAVLTPDEADQLFTLMRAMRDRGCSLIFVSHKLREIMAVTDHVSVMRLGRMVMHAPTASTSPDALAKAMMGHTPVSEMKLEVHAPGAVALRAETLRTRPKAGACALHDVSLTLRRGEIAGIAGIAGNGQTELLDALMGLEPLCAGEVEVGGERFAPAAVTVPAMRRCGLAYVPEDRMRRGLIADMSARDSLRLGHEDDGRDDHSERLMQAWDIRPKDPERITRHFSGGNQQKLILARELERAPSVLLIGQPTRGVDLGAMQLIHDRLRELRSRGCAILLVSSDLDELFALCDRILVLHRGAIAGERRAQDTTRHEIGMLMSGEMERSRA